MGQGTHARRSGQIDVVDLCVGGALLVLVPVLVYVVGAYFIEDHYVAPMGQKPKVDAPPDHEEVRMHLEEATNLVQNNAQHFLRLMEATSDGILRDKYRKWAQMALEEGMSKLGEVTNFLIKKHPDGDSVFSRELQKITQLRTRANADLRRVRELDILGGAE